MLIDRNEIAIVVDAGGQYHERDQTAWRFTKREDFLSAEKAIRAVQQNPDDGTAVKMVKVGTATAT